MSKCLGYADVEYGRQTCRKLTGATQSSEINCYKLSGTADRDSINFFTDFAPTNITSTTSERYWSGRYYEGSNYVNMQGIIDFSSGVVTGSGIDVAGTTAGNGTFTLTGTYNSTTGVIVLVKTYMVGGSATYNGTKAGHFITGTYNSGAGTFTMNILGATPSDDQNADERIWTGIYNVASNNVKMQGFIRFAGGAITGTGTDVTGTTTGHGAFIISGTIDNANGILTFVKNYNDGVSAAQTYTGIKIGGMITGSYNSGAGTFTMTIQPESRGL